MRVPAQGSDTRMSAHPGDAALCTAPAERGQCDGQVPSLVEGRQGLEEAGHGGSLAMHGTLLTFAVCECVRGCGDVR